MTGPNDSFLYNSNSIPIAAEIFEVHKVDRAAIAAAASKVGGWAGWVRR